MTTLKEEAIYQAALRGDSCVIQQALSRSVAGGEDEHPIDLDWALGPWGETPLHAAAMNRHVEVVEILIEAGADPNARDKLGETPFHRAIQFANVGFVEFWFENGADVRAVDNHGWTVLHWAANNAVAVKFLLENGAAADLNATDNANRTPLHLACEHGCMDVVKFFLACINIELEAKDNEDNTPLHFATREGHLSVVELLLDNGANLEAQDDRCSTPLHLASYCGYFYVVKALVERRANIFATDNDAGTPLDDAIERNRTAVSSYLLQRYRETVIEQEANLCLHSVLRRARYTDVDADAVKVVLPIGTLTMEHMMVLLEQFVVHCPDCVQAHDDSGEVALQVACRTASPVHVVRFLVGQDADRIRSRDNVNQATLLNLACRTQGVSIKVLRFLVDQYSAALSLMDATGSLPLHAACGAGLDLEKIKFLVEEGGVGTLTARDKHGALPLHVLCSSWKEPDVEVVEYLARQHPKPYPQALEEKTKCGDLPIMMACEHSASLSVVYALMRAHPGALINK